MRHWKLVCSFVSCIVVADRIGVQDCIASEAAKVRFLSEYANAAKILEQNWRNCAGTFRVVASDRKTKRGSKSVDFFRSNGYEKLEIDRYFGPNPVDKSKVVYCLGDDNSYFVLEKVQDETGYRIADARFATPSDTGFFELDYRRMIRANLGGYMDPLLAMMKDGRAQVIDARQVTDDGREMEVTFGVSNESLLKRLVVKFDTGNHWSVLEQSYFAGEPPRKTETYRVEYGPAQDGIAFPIRIHTDDRNWLTEFDRWELRETPKSEFLLPHYGLPDVIDSLRPKYRLGPVGLALLTGMVLSLFAGIMLSKYTKRHAAA